MKKIMLIPLTVLFIVVLFYNYSNSFAFANEEVIYCSYFETNVYIEKNTESIIVGTLAPNEEISVVDITSTEDDTLWCTVNYLGLVYYVERDKLYEYRPSIIVKIYRMQTTVTKVGEDIMLYSGPGEYDLLRTIKDGVLVEVLGTAGSYTKIKYDQNTYYIKTKNITAGVTYYQRLAIIISLVSIFSVIIVLILISLIKKQSEKKKSTEL
ncbi:MAG: hypothetical protein LBF68_06750 [Christensenellaceae bacterium]|jgi:hypothetical protein|nr:hypothetical protein [Christensenellaceae bacterium]